VHAAYKKSKVPVKGNKYMYMQPSYQFGVKIHTNMKGRGNAYIYDIKNVFQGGKLGRSVR